MVRKDILSFKFRREFKKKRLLWSLLNHFVKVSGFEKIKYYFKVTEVIVKFNNCTTVIKSHHSSKSPNLVVRE